MLTQGDRVGRYVVQGTLGCGATAQVWKVQQQDLGTQHALKLLYSTDPTLRERLHREGLLQAHLRHPNLVAVTDTVMVDGHPGLVMEYVKGPTLEARLKCGVLSEGEALAIFRQILLGVQAIHARGVIHRDLKPANILLEGGHTPRIMDFGIARIIGSAAALTVDGSTAGTPWYMAPEQWVHFSEVDPRADIFSLGCILYQMLAGHPPYAFKNIKYLWVQLQNRSYDLRPIPLHLRPVLEQALHPDPAARIPDCASFLALLGGSEGLTCFLEAVPRARRRNFDPERALALALDRQFRRLGATLGRLSVPEACVYGMLAISMLFAGMSGGALMGMLGLVFLMR